MIIKSNYLGLNMFFVEMKFPLAVFLWMEILFMMISLGWLVHRKNAGNDRPILPVHFLIFFIYSLST